MDLAKIRKKAGSRKKKARKAEEAPPVLTEAENAPSGEKTETGDHVLEESKIDISSGPDPKEESAGLEIREFLLFRLGREYYGFSMDKISEIINIYSITPVPRAPLHLKGIISLRGRIIPVIDLKKLLRIHEEDAEGGQHLLQGTRMVTKRRKKGLVAEGPHGPLALLNDGVLEVLRIPEEELFPPPANLTDEELQFIEQVFIHEEKLVSVLRVEKALHVF
jgi:purine-binding chemotaxis protein CheW